MKQQAARTSTAIKVITTGVFILTAGFFVGSYYVPALIFSAVILCICILLCYLWAPVAYELTDHKLKVYYRWGGKEFDQVRSCTPITEKPKAGIRLFGNGGLFCATGFFWNKQYGVFRAYVSSARLEDLMLVETADHKKIVISPEDRSDFALGE